MLLSVICVFVCVYSAYVYMCRRYLPPVNPVIPTHPGKLPIVGHAYKWMRAEDRFDALQSLCKFSYDNGGVTTMYLGPYPVYVICDPEDALTVLQKCLDKVFIYKLIEPFVGKMLVAAEVPVWKRTRRFVDLGFKQNIVDNYLEVFKQAADSLTESMEEYVGQGKVDISNKVTRNFLETAFRTTLGPGFDNRNIVNDKYISAVYTILDIMAIKFCKPWYMLDPIFNLSSYGKKLKESLEITFSLSEKMIKLRKEEHMQRLKNKQNPDLERNRLRSFLDVFIENTVTESGSVYTDLEMRNIVDNILLAAYDTTICQMILVLVCLGSYPEVQKKIHEEITNVLGENGKVTKDNLSLLVYLEAAIKEALRLYPVGMAICRQSSTEVKLRNTTIPAGSGVVLHLWAINRNPKYWGEDANKFQPERWLDDSLPEHPAAFASFSPGRRGCPGKPYTLMYFKSTLVPLIKRFKFTADHTQMKLDFNALMKLRSGHDIKIEYR